MQANGDARYLPFSIAFEYCSVLAERQMVDEVQTAGHDESASDPQRARIPTKDNLLLAFGADVDVVCGRDQDTVAEVVSVATLDD